MKDAACAGQWELFDSTDWRDHLAARDICATCPLLLACHREATSMRSSKHGAPTGTWAGVLYDTTSGTYGCVVITGPTTRRRTA